MFWGRGRAARAGEEAGGAEPGWAAAWRRLWDGGGGGGVGLRGGLAVLILWFLF